MSDSTPYRPAQFYAPAGASLSADVATLTRGILNIRLDLEALRDLLLPTLDAPTRERLRNAEYGEWGAALSGLEVGNGD